MRPASAHPAQSRNVTQPSKRPFSAAGKITAHVVQNEAAAQDSCSLEQLNNHTRSRKLGFGSGEDRVSQSEVFSKESWKRRLLGDAASGAGPEAAKFGLPTFDEWRRAKHVEQLRQEWKPKENKSSSLRKQLGEELRAVPQLAQIKIPDTLETLKEIEQRVRTKLSKQSHNNVDVGVEPLMLELQIYDTLCADVLKQGDLACPAVSGLFRLLWDSFLSVLNESLKLELQQIVSLQENNKQLSRELLSKSRELHDLQLKSSRVKSTLDRKAIELVGHVQRQRELQNEVTRLQNLVKQHGIMASFDPLSLSALGDVLDETDINTKHAATVLRQMEELTAAQGVKDVEFETFVQEQQKEIPARFRAELERLLAENKKLDSRLETEKQDMLLVKESVEKFASMVQHKPKQEGNTTPRADWSEVVCSICPQLRDVKMPTMQHQKDPRRGVTVEHAQYKGASADKVKLMAGILARLMPPATLAVRAEVSREAFFEPLGTTRDVPAFLRSKNKVRNRNITKRDTEQLIRAIWSSKQEEDKSAARRGAPPPSLHDHIYQHLRVRFGNFPNIIAEWGYNLLEGCRRYAEDADIELFKLVIEDEVGEEVVQDQFKLVSGLQDRLRKEDLEANFGVVAKHISVDRFASALKAFFPFKGKLRLGFLVDCAFSDHPSGKNEKWAPPATRKSGKVQYESLFQEDENLDQGPFLEGVRDQYLQERTEYLIEVERQLRKEAPANGEAYAFQCRKAVSQTDPQIPDAELTRIWCAAFRTDPAHPPEPSTRSSIDDFIRGLRRVAVKWHSPFSIEVSGVVIDL